MISLCCGVPLLGARTYYQACYQLDYDYQLCSRCLRPCDKMELSEQGEGGAERNVKL